MITAGPTFTGGDALEQAKYFLGAIVESSRDSIITVDFNGVITTWNSAAASLYGYPAAEAIGKNITMLLLPEDLSQIFVNIDEIRSGRSVARYDTIRVQKNGERIDLDVVMSPVKDSSDRIVGVSTIVRDITKRKLAEKLEGEWREALEQRVEERTAELVEANRQHQAEIEKRLKAEQDRVQILARLTTAQEDERRRIARDLHDQIGQQITALRLSLNDVEAGAAAAPELVEKVSTARGLAQDIDAEAGFLAYELRPAGLEDLGLRISIRDYVAKWSVHHKIKATFHATEAERRPLSFEVNTHIYRIVQEALNNVLKHANAKNVAVVMNFRDGELNLIIQDDGVGFDPDAAKRNHRARSGGFGLIGMRERCHLIGGELSIDSTPGDGTAILCRIPIGREKGKPDQDNHQQRTR